VALTRAAEMANVCGGIGGIVAIGAEGEMIRAWVRLIGLSFACLLAAWGPAGHAAESLSITAQNRSGQIEFRLDLKGGAVSGSFSAETWNNLRDWMPSGTGLWTEWLRLRTKGTFQGKIDADRRITGAVVTDRWEYDGVCPTSEQAAGIAKEGRPPGGEHFAPLHESVLRMVERSLKLKTLATEGTLRGRVNEETGAGSIGVAFRNGKIGSPRDPFYDQAFFGVDWEFKLQPAGTPGDASGQTPPPADGAGQPPATPPMDAGQRFFIPALTADKEAYSNGERVTLTLAVDEWENTVNEQGAPLSRWVREAGDSVAAFETTFYFPSVANLRPLRLQIALPDDKVFVPFAPFVPGTYRIEARMLGPQSRLDATRRVLGTDWDATARVEFECLRITPLERKSAPLRVDAAIQRYLKETPSHRAEVRQAIDADYAKLSLWDSGVTRYPVSPPAVGDMEWGGWNNIYFGEKEWNCAGCSKRTIDFLNDLRFLDRDPRSMVGLHYAPLWRGFSNGSKLLAGEHYAVAIWPDGEPMIEDATLILDTWPKQQPAVFTMKDFRWFYGWWYAIGAACGVEPDTKQFDTGSRGGFPSHGGAVYWNRRWRKCPTAGGNSGEAAVEVGEPGDEPPPHRELPRPMTHILGLCPIGLRVTSTCGDHLGLVGGKIAGEIPGSQLFVHPKGRDDLFWCLALPDGSYRIEVDGLGSGPFALAMARGATFAHYAAKIEKGQTARLDLAADVAEAPPLALPDGSEVKPAVVRRSGGPALSEAAALAELRRRGGVLIHFRRNEPGQPVVLVDAGNHPHFADDWMPYVVAFRQLAGLSLAGTAVTDAGLRRLGELTDLETLVLDGTQVTDACLPHLSGLSKLRHLDLRGTRISADGIAKIQLALPDAEVASDDP
jgi:hypothetical protein